MWLFIELGCYYKISKQKGEKIYYGEKYKFNPELDLRFSSKFSQMPEPDCWSSAQFSKNGKEPE